MQPRSLPRETDRLPIPEVALTFSFCFQNLGATQVPVFFFWSFSGLLLVVDTTGKPNFISRYRIQVGKNDPVSVAAASPGQSTENKG